MRGVMVELQTALVVVDVCQVALRYCEFSGYVEFAPEQPLYEYDDTDNEWKPRATNIKTVSRITSASGREALLAQTSAGEVGVLWHGRYWSRCEAMANGRRYLWPCLGGGRKSDCFG